MLNNRIIYSYILSLLFANVCSSVNYEKADVLSKSFCRIISIKAGAVGFKSIATNGDS
jgi:hypothetical protein